VVLLNSGHTNMTELADILGYANHSAVSKRPADRRLGFTRRLLGIDLSDRPSDVRVPVLVLAGTADRLETDRRTRPRRPTVRAPRVRGTCCRWSAARSWPNNPAIR